MANTCGQHRFDIVLELDAPIAVCYEVCYREEHMAQWVPMHKSVVYDHAGAAEPYGPGSNRLVTVKSGATLREHIIETNKPDGMVYAIFTFGKPFDWLVHDYQGHIRFKALSDDRTLLIWSIHYDCHGAGKALAPLLQVAYKKLIGGMCRKIQQYIARLPSEAKLTAV